jgi:hypothetical protein
LSTEVKGPEAIVLGVKTIFETYLPTKLQALDEEFEDFTLPALQAVYAGGSSGRTVWPSITIGDADLDLVAPLAASDYSHLPIDATCLYLEEGEGRQRLMQVLWRYQRAMIEVLWENRVQPDYWLDVVRVQHIAAGPFPVVDSPDSQQVLGWGAAKGLRAWFLVHQSYY